MSCGSCLGWGQTYTMGLCVACYSFARGNPRTGPCTTCRRVMPMKKGYCRLCWCQADQDRRHHDGDARSKVMMEPWLPKVTHQQLFLLCSPRRVPPPPRIERRRGIKGRPLKNPPPAAVRPRTDSIQLPLFPAPRRQFSYGRIDLRRGPVPDNPWLAWALHLAHLMGQARGWSPIVAGTTQRTLVMLLAHHVAGDTIRASDINDVIKGRGASFRRAAELLDIMGIWDQDLPATFEAWLTSRLQGLSPGFADPVNIWARTLRDGGPRVLPRDEGTVGIYVRAALPALLDWTNRHDHLREVTRDDVLTHLGTLTGQQRETLLSALRSLFGWAKRQGVIFRDPASRIKIRRPEPSLFQPLEPEHIARTIQVAASPAARLFVALAAVHAARHHAIRSLQLDDIDLGNRQIIIAGRPRPLDDLTHRILTEWLTYRRERWPTTANPHLLISQASAVGTGPVSSPWIGRLLRGQTATLERLRIDRQLEEALANRADPLHLVKVFDIDDSTAVRYAASARALLTRPHEDHPPSSPGTRVSEPRKPPPASSGSH
ncbi:site-specific integrase [Nonomuraea phyllanthi]|nr:hypothetical protein [Nonomuraea phyllanthi]